MDYRGVSGIEPEEVKIPDQIKRKQINLLVKILVIPKYDKIIKVQLSNVTHISWENSTNPMVYKLSKYVKWMYKNKDLENITVHFEVCYWVEWRH